MQQLSQSLTSTLLSHLLPASALSSTPTRSKWPLEGSRSTPRTTSLRVPGMGTVRKDTARPSMLATMTSTSFSGLHGRKRTHLHSQHHPSATMSNGGVLPLTRLTPPTTRSSRAAFARATAAAGYIGVGEPWKCTFKGSGCSRGLNH